MVLTLRPRTSVAKAGLLRSDAFQCVSDAVRRAASLSERKDFISGRTPQRRQAVREIKAQIGKPDIVGGLVIAARLRSAPEIREEPRSHPKWILIGRNLHQSLHLSLRQQMTASAPDFGREMHLGSRNTVLGFEGHRQ